MATHPSIEELQAFDRGRLDPAAAEEVRRHLTTCADCRLQATRRPGAAPRPRPADVPPALADHPEYEIVRELGRGGMGVVYLARNRLMGRPEVLKVLGREVMDRPGAADRFLAEVQAAARLAHPNIVTAYAARRLGDLLVFAMEYVEGEDLHRVVTSRGPLPVALACAYAHQAALGLQHAFEKGMAHRDIKPHNLILHRSGGNHVIKILDFGLAKVAGERPADHGLTREGQALGTPAYMAPEQIRDARTADTRSDLYSLGCTLYFLLTGRPPFEADSVYALFHQHLSAEPARLHRVRPDAPPGLSAVVARLLAKDPARRFQTPAEAAQALVPFFRDGAPTPAEGTAGPTRAAPGPRRRRALRWAAVALGVLVLAGLALWAGGVLRVKTPHGTIVVENVPADAEVRVDGDRVTMTRDGDRVVVEAVAGGEYPLKVVRPNGEELLSEKVQLRLGGEPVRVRVERPAAAAPPGAAPAATLTGKQPAPAAARVAELQRAARDALKTELASGRPADLSRAAQRFLSRADALERPDEKFAVLDLARDLAAQAGDFDKALDVCARLDREFLIDPLAVKVRTLQRLARAEVPAESQPRLRDAVLTAGFEALAADDYGPARDAARLAADLAARPPRRAPANLPRLPGGSPYAYQARFLGEEVERAEPAYARLPAAAKQAEGVTDDPGVNAARGLFLCLAKNDWAKGVEFLRAGPEPWRTLAEREDRRPAGAAGREALGDLWWQAAERLPAADAPGARRRARYWYLGALARMKPAEREAAAARLQPRIDQVPRTPITLHVRLTELNGYHWLRISSDGVQTTGRGDRKITGEIRANHLRWKDHVAGHRNAGAARLLPDGVDFSTTQLVNVSASHWGAVNVTATPEAIELAFWHAPVNENSNYDLILTVESAGYDLPARFGRQWDVAYYNWPEKAPPANDRARAALFAGAPADRLKQDTINFIADSSPTDAWRPGGPPSKKVGADRFALVATSTWQLPAGRYQARTYADDGVRVLIDGRVALDNWQGQGDGHAASGDLRLAAGAHPIRVEYYQIEGAAILQFDLVRLGD